MTKLLNFSLILSACLSFTLGGCTQKASDQELHRTAVDQAEQKIDQGRYEEAISDMNQFLQQDPDNDRARTVLASAYVRRAGITIRDYFALQEVFQMESGHRKNVIDLNLLEKLKLGKDSKLKVIFDFLKTVNDISSTSADISDKYEALPTLEVPQAEDIYNALQTLSELKKPTDGMFLYRGRD